ncbi:MAG: hypothetical protein ABFD25_07745 [Clostridiaceae bacterium]
MIFLWWLILIVLCFTPCLVYFAITKKYGGEPLVLKDKSMK